jgi:hypothetical protein
MERSYEIAIAYNSDNNSFIYEKHDQIKELIADMRENIMSTRLKVASWNPSEINKTASSMSRQFPSHRVPLFDNEMIALAGKNGANISANETRRVNKKWVFQDLKCIGTKKHRYVSGFPFNI